jgi:hypothetical protein
VSNPSPSPARGYVLATSRLLGAFGLLATGGIHLEQYIVADYRAVPTIGPLFLLNFIAGTLLGLYFLVPARASGGPIRRWVETSAALAGWGVAAGSLVALLISEHTLLFGFMEHGYRLEIVIAIVAEGITLVAVGAVLALMSSRSRRGHHTGRGSGGAIPVTPRSTATESS